MSPCPYDILGEFHCLTCRRNARRLFRLAVKLTTLTLACLLGAAVVSFFVH